MMYERAGSGLDLVAVEDLFSVLGSIAVGIEESPEPDELLLLGGERRIEHPVPHEPARRFVLATALRRRRRENQPLAAIRHRHEVVEALHVHRTARVHLAEAVVRDEFLGPAVGDGERAEVRRVTAECGLRFFSGWRIGGEPGPDLRHDVDAHVSGVGVDDVAVRVVVRRRRPLARRGVFDFDRDELVGPDEPRAIGHRRGRRSLPGHERPAEHARHEHQDRNRQDCRQAPWRVTHPAPFARIRAVTRFDRSSVGEAYHVRPRPRSLSPFPLPFLFPVSLSPSSTAASAAG